MKPRTIEEMTNGLTGKSSEIIAKATASIRHQDRIDATLEAANTWFTEDRLTDENRSVDDFNIATIILLVTDMCIPGTLRHLAFSSLGKGRKEASDGAAYMAAAYELLDKIAIGMKVEKTWSRAGPCSSYITQHVVFNCTNSPDNNEPDEDLYLSLRFETSSGPENFICYPKDLVRLLGPFGANEICSSLLREIYFKENRLTNNGMAPPLNIGEGTTEQFGKYLNGVNDISLDIINGI